MKIALHWFRCDLRLSDNTALHAAISEADIVIPVFIFDPLILGAIDTGTPIVGFMLDSLGSLEKDVGAAGGKLVFRNGKVVDEMRSLLQATQASALYFNRDYEPNARRRDDAVSEMAATLGVEVHTYKDGVLHEPDEILKADGEPYRVFTAYSHSWRRLKKAVLLPKVRFKRSSGFKNPSSLRLPTAASLGLALDIKLPPGGETAGRARLKEFASNNLLHYADRRDIPAMSATSGLSPHLRMGTISPRTVLAVASESATKNHAAPKQFATFESELIWRDFYRQILWHFPHVATSSFKEKYNGLKWENDKRLFAAWCQGRTGFPIVDAGMRQLNTTGWMHNRVRMIVAMFLTKDLLVSWQWGERYFMQKLIDADLASNNGGWQWSASTGTDAQPYFRIFNPISQAEKFDPEGAYIRKYVPEVDTRDYPAPIVNHAHQRVKALALFKR
jgi:deoxyribodipyrimidine photo-lyase